VKSTRTVQADKAAVHPELKSTVTSSTQAGSAVVCTQPSVPEPVVTRQNVNAERTQNLQNGEAGGSQAETQVVQVVLQKGRQKSRNDPEIYGRWYPGETAGNGRNPAGSRTQERTKRRETQAGEVNTQCRCSNPPNGRCTREKRQKTEASCAEAERETKRQPRYRQRTVAKSVNVRPTKRGGAGKNLAGNGSRNGAGTENGSRKSRGRTCRQW